MRLKIFVLIIVFTLATMAFAETPNTPKPVLKKGDVDHFIKTFPQLKEDFKKFEVKYDGKSGAFTYPLALKASGDFLGVLKKHGWDEHFFTKMTTIFMGYSMIFAGVEMAKADPQFAKNIEKIKSNTHLSEEMKKQMVDQLMQVKGMLNNQQKFLKGSIQKADMELIKARLEELQKLFIHKKKK